MKIFRMIFLAIVVCCFSIPAVRANEGGIWVVRDAEIEDFFTDMAKRIFKVAKLNPKSAHVYVIDSSEINAFTIGDGYIFITSGLLMKYDNPLHILAIMCHEIGHIAAGHIDRQISAIKSSSQRFGIAAIASIIGGALTGSPDAAALLLGYAMTDARFYLRFSRSEEFAADALAAQYLQALGYSSDLLIESFEVFRRIDLLNSIDSLPVYVSTHPKTDSRINALNKWCKYKHYFDEELYKRYRPIIAKIKANARKFSQVCPTEDSYLKVIYLENIGKIAESIRIMRKLIQTNKNNIYYTEMLAQLLHENGQLEESVREYQKIYSEQVNNIIKIDYAGVLIDLAEKNEEKRWKCIKSALKIIEKMQYELQVDSEVFRLLGKAYGLEGNRGMSTYFIGREQLVLRNYRTALSMLRSSLKLLSPKSTAYKTAKYLVELAKRKINY